MCPSTPPPPWGAALPVTAGASMGCGASYASSRRRGWAPEESTAGLASSSGSSRHHLVPLEDKRKETTSPDPASTPPGPVSSDPAAAGSGLPRPLSLPSTAAHPARRLLSFSTAWLRRPLAPMVSLDLDFTMGQWRSRPQRERLRLRSRTSSSPSRVLHQLAVPVGSRTTKDLN